MSTLYQPLELDFDPEYVEEDPKLGAIENLSGNTLEYPLRKLLCTFWRGPEMGRLTLHRLE
jgi:hypothetical protein